MKKLVIAAVLATVAGMVSAAEVRLEGQDANGTNGTASQRVYELGIKESINNNLAGDIVVKNYRTDGTDALATRYEAGLTASTSVGLVSPYARVAVGEKQVSGASGFSYYSVEPGVAVKQGAVGVSLGYRFQDAFSNSQNDTTRTWRAKLGYDVTKNDTIYIGYDRQRGDSDQNITKVGLIHRF